MIRIPIVLAVLAIIFSVVVSFRLPANVHSKSSSALFDVKKFDRGTTSFDKNGNPVVRGQAFDDAMRVDEEEPGKVRVKRVLWDGTVQDDVYKPQDIKIFEGKNVTRGVDTSGMKTHESTKNHLIGAFSGEAKKGKGVSFNYDPDKYKDVNAANYRKLGTQLKDLKEEEDTKAKKVAEEKRREAMKKMFMSKESGIFWDTPAETVVADSEKFFVPPRVTDIIDDLDNVLIGLQPVKEKMRRYASQMLVHQIRNEFGLKSEIPPLHHVFTGNPGTGKTTVAMKMGELYQAMGFIKRGHTVQATRADLVGQYIGHTGPKTREVILQSFGGILFIDEAYGLYKEDSRDYGSEVLELLVKFIDTTQNSDFVLVLAGYRNLMTRMLNNNLNLMSRMGNWVDFPDYDDKELVQISDLLANQYSYNYPQDTRDVFVEYMNLRKEFPYFSNARTVRNTMERARRIAAERVLKDALDTGTCYTMDEIQTFQPEDFKIMVDEIRGLDRSTMLP